MTKSTLIRALTVGAATAAFALAGTASAQAAPANTSAPDPSCLQEGTEAVLADPAGALEAAVHDPAGTVDAEVACVKEVLGL